MTPSERERRIEAGVAALQLKVAEHAMKGIDDWSAIVEAVLDAADKAVPMVSLLGAIDVVAQVCENPTHPVDVMRGFFSGEQGTG